MSWKTAKLADLATVSSGGGAPQDADAFSTEGAPFVRAGSLIKLLDGLPEESLELLQPDVAAAHKLKLFPAGTVVFAKSGMSATKGHIYQLKKPAYVVNHLAALTPRSEIAGRYLRRVLEFRSPTCLIKDEAYPSIRLGEIENMEVPAPVDDTEMERIVAILDQAGEVRCKRQRAIDRLNQLGQAIFHEMFGDPITNPMGWPVGTIRDLIAEAKYGTAKKANSDGQGTPILRMGNITYDGQIDLSDIKYVELTGKEFSKYTTKFGDILFNRTNSRELVGKTAVVMSDKPLAIAGYLVRARVNDKGNPFYISAYLNSPHGKKTLRSMCKNIVGMANINAQEFQDIRIALPPKDRQDKFQEAVLEIESSKVPVRAALAHTELLFSSLQHRAFRGEL